MVHDFWPGAAPALLSLLLFCYCPASLQRLVMVPPAPFHLKRECLAQYDLPAQQTMILFSPAPFSGHTCIQLSLHLALISSSSKPDHAFISLTYSCLLDLSLTAPTSFTMTTAPCTPPAASSSQRHPAHFLLTHRRVECPCIGWSMWHTERCTLHTAHGTS
eukprot:1139125-Pelagomonas_calceolata.AAC.5